MGQCSRYHSDGERCTNPTDASDGWCRQPGCGGFVRPSGDLAPESHRSMRGTARHIRETGHVPVGIDLDEVEDIRISQRAEDSFRFHHGGSAAAARSQLTAMLEDFLLKSARSFRDGYAHLARAGFHLSLSPDLSTVVGYSTAHRERTWEQVKAGVPSRFPKVRRASPSPHRRTPSGEQHPSGPVLDPAAVGAAVDPATIHLTGLIRTNFARFAGLRQASDEELDAVLRSRLGALASGELGAPREFGVEILAGGLRWIISADARMAINVGRLRPAGTASVERADAGADERADDDPADAAGAETCAG